MDKIYSRKRIRFPILKLGIKGNQPENKRKQKLIKIICILIIAGITINFVLRSVGPVFDKLCEVEAKSIATKISNNQATKVMKNYQYEDLFRIMKDNEGNIVAINSNMIIINEIISDVAIRIQNELEKVDVNNVSIALGTFTGSKLLSGRGPKIKIRITSVGDVDTDFRSEFKQAGINQTLHRLYLQVDCKVAILTPFNTIERNISNQVILAENIIVGAVPSTYYNLEGMNGTGDALEIIE